MAEFNPKSDLIQNTKKHLKFLQNVNKHQNLYEGHLVTEALYRYEKFWLVLASRLPGELLIPPLDIQWVWHVHMLAPKTYENDCNAVVGKIVDTRFPQNSREATSASKLTRQSWVSSFPDEPFQVELDRDWTKVSPRTCKSKISCDLKKAIAKQKLFYYNVALPHYNDYKFLEDALARYKKFLRLIQLNPDASLVPCYDISLVWHAHLREPVNYSEETKEFFGRVLNHRDAVKGSEFIESYQATRQLWSETFDDNLSKEGCMFRGYAPANNLAQTNTSFSPVSASPFNYTANKYSISLMKMELNDCQERSIVLGVYKRYRYTEDKRVLRRSGPNMTWAGRPPKGMKNFDFDSSKCSHLSLVLRTSKGVCCFKEGDEIGRHHLALMNDPDTDYSSTQELNYNLPLMLTDNTPAGANAHLKMTRFPLKRGPLVLRVLPKSFSSHAEPSDNVWGPVPLPMRNPARPELPNDVYTATHSLLNHHNKIAYKVQLIHGALEGMSAVMVRNERDTQVISEGHLIGPDQLPLRDQVNKPEKCVFLSDQRTERAILIRDAEGDWGICVARWAAYTRNENNQPVLQKKVGKKNPGFLNLRFYNLRKKKMTRIYLPSQEKYPKSFRFDFNLDDVYVDLENGHLTVSKNSADHAQNVALGFSVCVLFALCQPYPPTEVPVTPRVPIDPTPSPKKGRDQPPPIPTREFPQPRYKPSDWRTPRKKLYSNDDLVFISAVGYWYYSKYPVYYETEVSSDFCCRNFLVWDEKICQGDFSKGVDDSGKDEDMDSSCDNEMITLEEFIAEESVPVETRGHSEDIG